MNLSKDELVNLLYSVGTEWCSYEEKIRSVAVAEALKEGTLEVEGYERVQWTKFDKDDPAIFPPDDKLVLAYGYPDPIKNRSCAMYFFAWSDSAGMFLGQESADPEVHFWRPLPKPPIETE